MKNLDQPRPFETIPEIVDYYKRRFQNISQKTNLTIVEQKVIIEELELVVDSYNLELMRMSRIVVTESEGKERDNRFRDLIEHRDKLIKDWLDYNILIIKL